MSPTPPEAFPFPTTEDHESPSDAPAPAVEQPSEDAIDQGLRESFPASDAVSVTTTKVKPQTDKRGEDTSATTRTDEAGVQKGEPS